MRPSRRQGDADIQTDRVVVITGAAGGVGSVLVERFLDNGDTDMATDANPEVLEQWRGRWDADAKLVTVPGDISSEEDCEALAQAIRERLGRVDVLVNCAGYFPVVAFEEMSVADWRKIIDVNLTGSFLIVRAMLPLMKERGWGRIVNFGSDRSSTGPAGKPTTSPPRRASSASRARWRVRSEVRAAEDNCHRTVQSNSGFSRSSMTPAGVRGRRLGARR